MLPPSSRGQYGSGDAEVIVKKETRLNEKTRAVKTLKMN
jgi:hypothetical protein